MNFTQMLKELYREKKAVIMLDSLGKESDWYLKINQKTKQIDAHSKPFSKIIIHNYEFTSIDLDTEWKVYTKFDFENNRRYRIRSFNNDKQISFNTIYQLFDALCKLNVFNRFERKMIMNKFSVSDLHAFRFIAMFCGFSIDIWKEKWGGYVNVMDTDDISRMSNIVKSENNLIDWINDKIHYYNKEEMINIMKGGK